jgi:hypothetical protein
MSDTLQLPALTALMPALGVSATDPIESIFDAPGPHTVTVEGLGAAEELLDRLEAAGVAYRKLVIMEDESFAVRWR